MKSDEKILLIDDEPREADASLGRDPGSKPLQAAATY
jgi:hypothetical protein